MIKVKRGSHAAMVQPAGTTDPTVIAEGEPAYDYTNNVFKIGHSSDGSPTRFDTLIPINKPLTGTTLPVTGTQDGFFYNTDTKQLYIWRDTAWVAVHPYFDDTTTIRLNTILAGAPTESGGLTINRGTLPDAKIEWDETNDVWKIGLDGAEYEIITTSNLSDNAVFLTTLKWGGQSLPALSANKILSNDGTSIVWIDNQTGIPSQTGNTGKILSTNGTDPVWITPSTGIPNQVSSSGKWLTTNGTDPAWASIVWDNVGEKPLTFAPAMHDNTAHSAVYITADGVTYDNLNINGDVGTGADQVAAGNHTHTLLHDALTISGNGLSLTGQLLSLLIGTGSTQVAAGNHTHEGGSGGSSSYIVQRTIEGIIYETTMMYWVAPAACTISSTNMYLSSNPSATGSYCKIQIMKNGLLETNSIFSSDTAMQITETTAATNGIYTASGTLDSAITTLATGDVIQFRVNQADVGSADLLVQLKVNFT